MIPGRLTLGLQCSPHQVASWRSACHPDAAVTAAKNHGGPRIENGVYHGIPIKNCHSNGDIIRGWYYMIPYWKWDIPWYTHLMAILVGWCDIHNPLESGDPIFRQTQMVCCFSNSRNGWCPARYESKTIPHHHIEMIKIEVRFTRVFRKLCMCFCLWMLVVIQCFMVLRPICWYHTFDGLSPWNVQYHIWISPKNYLPLWQT